MAGLGLEMALNWSDERYVRVYTRDTASLLAIGWEGRAVFWELLRKVDRAGVLDTGGDVGPVAEVLRVPVDVWERVLPRLRDRGMVTVTAKAIVVPHFIEAQEARQTDRQRQRESRAARLERALAGGADIATARFLARPDVYGPPVTKTDRNGHESGPNGHTRSHAVTRGHSVPSLAVPDPEMCVRSNDGPQGSLPLSNLPGDPDTMPRTKGEGKRTPRTRQMPQGGPMPYTVEECLGALRDGSGGRVAASPCLPGHAVRITAEIRALDAAGVTLADLRLAGECIAATWGQGLAAGPAWAATAGKMGDAVARAREWEARGAGSRAGGMTATELAGRAVRFASEEEEES